MNVAEIFSSIQGESSFAGTPCFFIRLSGCNLRCKYCDTPKAWGDGRSVAADELADMAIGSCMPIIEVTGGEPLLQPHFNEFVELLRNKSRKTVLVETNGSCDISVVPDNVIAVMDVKCPSSGESDSFDMKNISRLRYYDEVKFVISDVNDYEWAKSFIESSGLANRCNIVHFSPVYRVLESANLAEWLMRDCLDVRMQVQLHKLLGVR